MGAYMVAEAHKQCEAGTVAHFQSGFVAKTQTESVPGGGQGLPKPAEVLRVPLTLTVCVCSHRLPDAMKAQLTRWRTSRS